MPGGQLSRNEARAVPAFAIVGEYARPHNDKFVKHVALLRYDGDHLFGSTPEVWQCAPPVVAGPSTSTGWQQSFAHCTAHAFAHLHGGLTVDEIEGIQTTLAEIDTQTQPVNQRMSAWRNHYMVHPPVVPVIDEVTGRLRFRKFSCVGFVLECYDVGADIQLLDLDMPAFPQVELKTLASAYGDIVRNPKHRERFGVMGQGPWPIAMPGYVMHAVNRAPATVRSEPHMPAGVIEAEFPTDIESSGRSERTGMRAFCPRSGKNSQQS